MMAATIDLDIVQLSKGAEADSELTSLLNDMASGQLGELPLAASITGTIKDFWKAWYQARTDMEAAYIREAFDRMIDPDLLYTLKNNYQLTASIERSVVVIECLKAGNNFVDALNEADYCRHELLQFLTLCKSQQEQAASEVETMINAILKISLREQGYSAAEICQCWAVSRGIDILRQLALWTNEIYTGSGEAAIAKESVFRLIEDIQLLKETAGCALPKNEIADIAFTIGNCLTPSDPGMAIQFFTKALDAAGASYNKILSTRYNIANCLVRLARYDEAINLYAALVEYWYEGGDLRSVARGQVAMCLALWKAGRVGEIHDLLVQAIISHEANRPADTSIAARYQHKALIEEAYLLLITLNATLAAPGDHYKNEMICAAKAILSRDQLAGLAKGKEKKGWDKIIHPDAIELARIKYSLGSFPQQGLLLLISGINCLVWIIMGYSEEGDFIFETCISDEQTAEELSKFLGVMGDCLEADVNGDQGSLFNSNNQLKELSISISEKLSVPFRQAIAGMKHLFYLPHPFGNVDEFPPGALHINGSWLAQSISITRVVSFNLFFEILAINRAVVHGGKLAVIIHGAMEIGGPKLKLALNHGTEMNRVMDLLGFNGDIKDQFTRQDFINWLDGDVSVIHYIGHGISDNISESLPISEGNEVTILDIDKISGSRTPFVFICACVAGRVRAGRGGYQAGIASKIAERAAPAVVAFNSPITESRAYYLAKEFYRQASRQPLGEALCELFRSIPPEFPAYAWLSLTAYGDPAFPLGSFATAEPVPMSYVKAKTWDSCYRVHAVLRTEESRSAALTMLEEAPARLRAGLEELLTKSFDNDSQLSAQQLNDIEQAVYESAELTDPEKMSIHAFITAEHFFQAGVDKLPIMIPKEIPAVKILFERSNAMMSIAGYLFDMRINGLAFALQARLLTADQNTVDRNIAFRYRIGNEKLRECQDLSPFVKRMMEETLVIMRHFGAQV